MGGNLSKYDEDTILTFKEHLIEGKFVDSNGKRIRNTNKESNNVRTILRKFISDKVLNTKVNFKTSIQHNNTLSSVYDYNSNYIVKLDTNVSKPYLQNALKLTKYVHQNSNLGPNLKEDMCKIFDITIDEKTSKEIISQISFVEQSKKTNLNHLKQILLQGFKIYCLVLVMEKLEKTANDVTINKTLENTLENLLVKLHDIGVCHNDVHLGNFMCKKNKWYIIDFADASLITNKSKCTDITILRNKLKTKK